MILPDLQNNIARSRMEIPAMRGINRSNGFQPGDLESSYGITASGYPYTQTRPGRYANDFVTDAMSIAGYEGMYVVHDDGRLTMNDMELGQLTPGKKQFAVINTKLVIWPDKKYITLPHGELKNLGASVETYELTYTESTVTVSGGSGLLSVFQVGDTVSIQSAAASVNSKDFTILAISGNTITAGPNVFEPGTVAGLSVIERRIPDLDYICECSNRLWGVSSDDRTIYASALGDPTNWRTYTGLSTDSYAVAVGSAGDWTGICSLGGNVLCWKENILHKILGSYPAEYSLYDYHLDGVRSGCSDSLVNVNDVVYYAGTNGIYAYNGSTPTLISERLGSMGEFLQATAGSDGTSYYIAGRTKNSAWPMMVYSIDTGIWVITDEAIRVRQFLRLDNQTFHYIDGTGQLWAISDEGVTDDTEYGMVYQPFYETISGRKGYSKMILRVALRKGSYAKIYVSPDGKPWQEIFQLVGNTEDAVRVRLPITRCDSFRIKITGRGFFRLMGISREFSVKSEA